MKRNADIYLCLIAGSAIVLHAVLSQPFPFEREPTLKPVSVALGLGLLILPGYSLGLLARLYRHGVAAMAGSAVALSLAMAALGGSVMWLTTSQISVRLLESLLGGCTVGLSMLALWSHVRFPVSKTEIVNRWAALALVIVPLGLTLTAMSGFVPVSPATRFTEFFVVHTSPKVVVGIVNAEGHDEMYWIQVEDGRTTVRLEPIMVQAGSRWEGAVAPSPPIADILRLSLYRLGDRSPHLSLWVQPGESRSAQTKPTKAAATTTIAAQPTLTTTPISTLEASQPSETVAITPSHTSAPTATPAGSHVVVGVGDIAHCRSHGDEATGRLLDDIPGPILALGDYAYDRGTAEEFMQCFEPAWGRHKLRIRPAAGNHEYTSRGADPYFDYFGAAAGDPAKGYYSYEIGSWHVIVLNSNCSQIGGCEARSPQGQWLSADLAAHPSKCTLAYWHHPRWSSGKTGSFPKMQPFWQMLYDAGVDLVLVGHDHHYERFAPQNPHGGADLERGIRQFIVGTGGVNHYPLRSPIANSEVRNDDTYGVLKLTLHPASYDWEFIPVEGQTFTDSGSGGCY